MERRRILPGLRRREIAYTPPRSSPLEAAEQAARAALPEIGLVLERERAAKAQPGYSSTPILRSSE
jgi:hypothetical protein